MTSEEEEKLWKRKSRRRSFAWYGGVEKDKSSPRCCLLVSWSMIFKLFNFKDYSLCIISIKGLEDRQPLRLMLWLALFWVGKSRQWIVCWWDYDDDSWELCKHKVHSFGWVNISLRRRDGTWVCDKSFAYCNPHTHEYVHIKHHSNCAFNHNSLRSQWFNAFNWQFNFGCICKALFAYPPHEYTEFCLRN